MCIRDRPCGCCCRCGARQQRQNVGEQATCGDRGEGEDAHDEEQAAEDAVARVANRREQTSPRRRVGRVVGHVVRVAKAVPQLERDVGELGPAEVEGGAEAGQERHQVGRRQKADVVSQHHRLLQLLDEQRAREVPDHELAEDHRRQPARGAIGDEHARGGRRGRRRGRKPPRKADDGGDNHEGESDDVVRRVARRAPEDTVVGTFEELDEDQLRTERDDAGAHRGRGGVPHRGARGHREPRRHGRHGRHRHHRPDGEARGRLEERASGHDAHGALQGAWGAALASGELGS
eukprot:1253977-Prymnesium_polylepis.1